MASLPRPKLALWRPVDRWLSASIPQPWRQWLGNKGSLTARLIAASNGQFRVQVLSQKIGTAHFSEVQALGIAPQQRVLIREVILYGNDTPWVYARSILPKTTLTGRLRVLAKLDDRPLGALLFTDKTMHRGPIEAARIHPKTIPVISEHSAPPLWGRRSVFYLDNKPLLVSEIFLPGFNPYNIRD